MSAARPTFASGVAAARQRRTNNRIPQALMTRISTDSANKIIKASKTVEELVAAIVGRKTTEEDAPVKPSPVESKPFQNFIYGTILLNAATLGLQADLTGGAWDTAWLICENIFTMIFTAELVLKLYFLRIGFFYDVKRQTPMFWNLLDMVIVLLAILDCWVLAFYPETNTQLIRVMQLLRIMRIAKLLRLRRELVAIIEGLFCSMQCMVWIGFLLLIVIYAFGIFCRNVIGNLSNSHYDDMVNNEMYFGSLPRTMLTLFNVCLIDGWSTVVWPQMLFNPGMVVPLMIFLAVTCFGLMNALIGVIVERTTAAHQGMNSIQEEALRESKMRLVAQLLDVIDSSDEDGSGTICMDEFRQVHKKEYASDIFSALNLPPGFDASDLFGLLDSDGNGQLDRHEFLLGICRLIWCDEFQSQCLLNYGLSRVRKDLRSLHNDVREVLEAHRKSTAGQGPDDFPPKPDKGGADFQKSLTESLQHACQDVLGKSLDEYWLRKQQTWSSQDFLTNVMSDVSETCKTLDRERADDEVSLLDFCTTADEAKATLSRGGAGGRATSTEALDDALRRASHRVEDELRAARAEDPPFGQELVIELPPGGIEALEGRLDELARSSAAHRLALNSKGLLFVDGSDSAKRCVQQMVQELVPPGAEASGGVNETLQHPAPGEAETAAAAKKSRRRRLRRNREGPPEEDSSPPAPAPAPAPSSPAGSTGDQREFRVVVHPPQSEAPRATESPTRPPGGPTEV